MGEIYAVAGGKGGVGKSVVSILLSRALALDNKQIILVDADLGGANLHTLAGLNFPRAGIMDFLIKKTSSLEDILILTGKKNIRMISGGGEVLGAANLKSTVKQKLMRHIKKLDADHTIIDLGAGSSFNVLDFFLAADKHLLVVSTEPTSLQNVYEFLKLCIERLLFNRFYRNESLKSHLDRFIYSKNAEGYTTVPELLMAISSKNKKMSREVADTIRNFHPYLIVNMAQNQIEAAKYANAIQTTARQYLMTEVNLLTTIFMDKNIQNAIKRRQSLLTIKMEENHYSLNKMRAILDTATAQLAAN